MFAESLKLCDFRNYEKLEMEFGREMNIIYGDNGNGKTNILESLYLCAAGRSHRTARDADMIRNGAGAYYVKAAYRREGGAQEEPETVEAGYSSGGKKLIKINGEAVDRIGKGIGRLKAVIFSPEDVMVIRNSPGDRRRLIDMAISQQRPSYIFDLQKYNRIILQRNALLRQIRAETARRGAASGTISRAASKAADTLDVWDESLVKVGAVIMAQRRKYIEVLNRIFSEFYSDISGSKSENAEIKYAPSVRVEETEDQIACIEDIFRNTLKKTRDREIEACCTLAGPQRDDLRFMLGGCDFRNYGSQGQQRTAMLAMKLSEAEMINTVAEEPPLLLLDDVMSELDAKRRKYLCSRIQGRQTFITSADRDTGIENMSVKRYYYVVKGRVEREK
ncbi:MAG: DNA replication/repair protein RecF [Eubacteriales bacterium]|nr:DNA replication/repair protein RecF [Eubacteriales bacterium]